MAETNYPRTINITYTLVGNKIVDHIDVVGPWPVGAILTTNSFLTPAMDWAFDMLYIHTHICTITYMAYPMIHNRVQPMQFVSPWEANVVHGTQTQYGRYGTITA